MTTTDETFERWRSSLQRSGFAERQYRYDAESFGNRYLLVERPGLAIRIAHDRGISSIDVASSATDEWFDIALVLRMLGAPQGIGSSDAKSDMEELLANLDRVAGAFDAAEITATKEALHRLEAKRARMMFGSSLSG